MNLANVGNTKKSKNLYVYHTWNVSFSYIKLDNKIFLNFFFCSFCSVSRGSLSETNGFWFGNMWFVFDSQLSWLSQERQNGENIFQVTLENLMESFPLQFVFSLIIQRFINILNISLLLIFETTFQFRRMRLNEFWKMVLYGLVEFFS